MLHSSLLDLPHRSWPERHRVCSRAVLGPHEPDWPGTAPPRPTPCAAAEDGKERKGGISQGTVELITLTLLPLSVAMIAYALFTFYWRSEFIRRKQVGFFDDKVGGRSQRGGGAGRKVRGSPGPVITCLQSRFPTGGARQTASADRSMCTCSRAAAPAPLAGWPHHARHRCDDQPDSHHDCRHQGPHIQPQVMGALAGMPRPCHPAPLALLLRRAVCLCCF